MTKQKATITVDPLLAEQAMALADTVNFSQAVGVALEAFVRAERGRRDVEAYERQPLTVDETGPPRPATGDASDDTDWEAIYREVPE